MKRIYTIFLAMTLLILLSACKNELPEKFEAMPDTLSEEELTIPENTPACKCIESHYDNGELKEKYEILYDEYDHTIKKNKLDINTGEVIHSSLDTEYGLVYDEYGNLVKSILYGNDNNDIQRVFINTYDEAGNQTSITWYHNYSGELKKSSYYEMKYDEYGNETEWFIVDVDEGIEKVCKYTYEYDENGNITKKTVDDSDIEEEYTYEYDENGNVTKKTYDNSIFEEEYTYTYDDAGNMLTETQKSTKKGFGKKEEKFNVFAYVNEYDDHGNLIKKTCFVDPNVVVYEYDEKKRKILEIDGSSEIRYEYEDY